MPKDEKQPKDSESELAKDLKPGRDNPGSSGNENPEHPLKHTVTKSTAAALDKFRESEELTADERGVPPDAEPAHKRDEEDPAQ